MWSHSGSVGLAALLLALETGVTAAAVTEHTVEPDTGIETFRVADRGFEISLTQILPEQSLAFFLGRGFPQDAAARYAAACVFMTIVRNTGTSALDIDLRGWTVHGTAGEQPMETRESWLATWATLDLAPPQRIAFERSQFPTAQSFEPGDWNQGMSTVLAPPGNRFDLELRWRANGECQTTRLEGVRCAEH